MSTIVLKNSPSILGFAGVVGKKEGEGPLSACFDKINDDTTLGEASWEKSESSLILQAVNIALDKASVTHKDISCIFAGDLLNQSISTTFGVKDMNIPLVGLFGACSTMALSLGMASVFLSAGDSLKAIAATSSHFCSAERQFRYPLEYGSQRTPTAQWTVTGAGAAVVGSSGDGPYVRAVTFGKVMDLGVKDVNNMGAAMAPAAADTIKTYFMDTNTNPSDFDKIITGDLSMVGSELLIKLLSNDGYNIEEQHEDCGMMIYDRERQDVNAGGSGCGCSASVLCTHFLNEIKAKNLSRILFCGTGALMSPTSSMQGQSIPSIAHLVEISV